MTLDAFTGKLAPRDVLSPRQRSYCMSRIRGKDTGPERAVLALLRKVGHRPQMHARDLPGRPDFVFRRRRRVIFVHGCFWHRHDCRLGAARPRTNSDFWNDKLRINALRDRRNTRELRNSGWRVMIVWECQLVRLERVQARLLAFLAD